MQFWVGKHWANCSVDKTGRRTNWHPNIQLLSAGDGKVRLEGSRFGKNISSRSPH